MNDRRKDPRPGTGVVVEIDSLVRRPADEPGVEVLVRGEAEEPALARVVVRERAPRLAIVCQFPHDTEEVGRRECAGDISAANIRRVALDH